MTVGLCSCTPDTECRIEENVNCILTFDCDSIRATEDTTFVVKFDQIDSLTIKGMDVDSVLYDNEKSVSSVALPLRSDINSTKYNLVLNGHQYLLTINHQNEEHFISMECGCFVYHQIDTAYTNSGDTVEIINTSVENSEQTNLKLHLHFD